MSAHSASQRGGFFAALVAQVSDYLLEPIEETIEPEPVELEPWPVVAVVSAARKSGASTIARLLAAELATRADGAAVVASPDAAASAALASPDALAGAPTGSADAPAGAPTGSADAPAGTVASRRIRVGAPPTRAAGRLATALGAGRGPARGCGRLCVAAPERLGELIAAGRYLAPIVLDVPPDGSAAEAFRLADCAVVVASSADEPALLAAVVSVLGGSVLTAVNRTGPADEWQGRADLRIPDARVAARAAALGTRALGPLGDAISRMADLLGYAE